MNKPDGVVNLFPKYFTELHLEILEILGEEKCKKVNSVLGSRDTFKFSPIAIYLKRVEISKLLSEGELSYQEIAKKVNVCTRTVRIVQKLQSKKKHF